MIKELRKVRIKLVDDGSVDSDIHVNNYKDAIKAAREYICDSNREMVCAIYLSGNVPVSFIVLSEGAADFAYAPVGELVKTALLSNATGIILLHNHPGRSTYPSQEDISLTDKVIRACELVELKLWDHIIVPAASDVVFSFHEKKLISKSLNEYTLDIEMLSWGKAAEENTYEEKQMAIKIADRIISIHEVDEGYDYSIMDCEYREIDGGIYDDPEADIEEVLNDIVEDLKNNPDYNGAKGNIQKEDEMFPMDFEEVMEAVEKSNELIMPYSEILKIANGECKAANCFQASNSAGEQTFNEHKKRGR